MTHEGTERDTEGVGQDMSMPLKLFLVSGSLISDTSAHVPVQLWRHFVLARKFKSFCSKLLSYFLLYLYISCI